MNRRPIANVIALKRGRDRVGRYRVGLDQLDPVGAARGLGHRPQIGAPLGYAPVVVAVDQVCGLERRHTSYQRTTTFTSLPGTTISLTTSLAVDVGPHVRGARGQPLELVRRRVAGRLHAVAHLAVDLADELERVALQQRRIGVRPGLLPHAPAGEQVVGVGRQVRREREQQRRGGRRARSAARPASASRAAVDLVDELHDRGDRGVEREAAGQVGR